ncbi:zinc transport system substrate-binding protein [Breoghania corrubedonensis]|uniref:High-affinity zinc uptake system protein ZnuA n=1 Tax=Breoghania corrubedonensis TaxID=665038 RepID=A0A2T5VHY8_9HYPH|nr:zinc ABC transporter substrate-binding protein [Breoghania corrubedonensis]PTW63371.1 zinc transport system substrate-binding protein [Breoghania corrubedonensis]
MSFRPAPWGATIATLIGLAAITLPAAHAQVPKVVTSIKPVDALVAGVMGKLGTPRLLVQGGASPHSYALKPSDARGLDEANIVFRVSENLETFLNHPLETLAGKATVVDLAEADEVKTLGFREGAVWEEDEHAHHDEATHDDAAHNGTDHANHHHDHSGMDPHVWLDPANARAMVDAIADTLKTADPENADTYATNAAELNGRLSALEAKIAAELAPVRGRPFIVFHDGYHYFEHKFDIEASGAVAVDPEHQPGVARVREIRDRIVASGAICVFAEPQFRPQLVATLIDGTSARAGVLDPLGADVKPGPGAYEAMMENLAKSLHDCLAGS